MKTVKFLAAAAASVFLVQAMPSTASAVTVTNGSATFTISSGGVFGTTIFNNGSGNADLKPGFTYPNAVIDLLSAYQWYIRVPGIPAKSVTQLGNLQDADSITTNGNTISVKYTNLGNTTDAVDATFNFSVVGGPDNKTATVYTTVSLTGKKLSSSSNNVFNFYALLDMDIPGSNVNPGPGDTVSATINSAGISGTFTDGTGNPVAFGSFDAPGASRLEQATASTLRGSGKLGGSSAGASGYNLATSGTGTFTNSSLADAAIALQWSVALPVGGTATIQNAIATNTTAVVPEPATLGLLAPAGLLLARRNRKA